MKTVTKKLFALLLVAVMTFSAVPFGAAASGMSDAPAAQTLCEYNLNWKIFSFGTEDAGTVIGAGTDGANTGYKVTLDWAKAKVAEGYKFIEAHVEYPSWTGVKSTKLDAKHPYTVKSNVTVLIYVEPVEEETPVEPTPVEPTPVEPTPVEPTPVEPAPEEPAPEEVPTPVTKDVVILEGDTSVVGNTIEVVDGKMDVLNLLSVLGYAVNEYDVTVDDVAYSGHGLRTVPAPEAAATYIKLTAKNVVEAEPIPATIKANVIENKKTRTFDIAVEDGKMDVLALLSENGYAVGEYTVVVDGKTYDLGALSAVPAPAGNTTTVELKAENTAVPGESVRHPVITFIANGGSWGRGKTEMSVTVKHGHSLGRQMPEDPTMKNQKFAGWRIVDTDVYIDEDTKFYEDTNVEAVWVSRRDTFTITFDPNGGSLGRRDPKEIEVRYKEVLDDLPVPTHRNMEFQGWFDQTGKEWEDGDIFNITYDITLTAKWAKAAKVVLHIYMDGNTRKSVYDIELHDYVVGDYITMKHVKRDIWETGIEAKPGKQLEYDGLFDSESWERYVRHGRGGEDKIEIENTRRNDIYVMVFNGQTHHRPWDPTNPKTGDQMMLEGAITVMALAAVGVVTLTALRKKKVL